MKTVDLTPGSTLVAWAKDHVFAGEYTKADAEDDGPEFTKFNRHISGLPEDKRLACVYVFHGEEAVREEFRDSAFFDQMELVLPATQTHVFGN